MSYEPVLDTLAVDVDDNEPSAEAYGGALASTHGGADDGGAPKRGVPTWVAPVAVAALALLTMLVAYQTWKTHQRAKALLRKAAAGQAATAAGQAAAAAQLSDTAADLAVTSQRLAAQQSWPWWYGRQGLGGWGRGWGRRSGPPRRHHEGFAAAAPVAAGCAGCGV